MYRKSLLGDADLNILAYTSSMEEDKEIVSEVIESLIAHVKVLIAQNLIPAEKGDKILSELNSLLQDPLPLFSINAEDVHEAIEIYLKEVVGEDEGYLALGKSRNDHVSAALRLKTKKLIIEQLKELINLRKILLDKAEKHLWTVMPAFTHLQPAQPSTFAHYLCYIEEVLADYTKALFFVLKVIDKSPLGGGAVAGTSVPLDRDTLAKELFSGIVINSIKATSSRDFLSIALSMDVSLSVFLSRIAEDIVIFSTPQFDYLVLPKEHLATSSMMPQKKNPVTMEIARAWGSESIGHLTALLGTLKGLPTGYNLDMQETNKHALIILKKTLETLKIFSDFFKKIEVNKKKLLIDAEIFPILATDIAEKVSLKSGKPYREVYTEIAELIKSSQSVEEIYSKVEAVYGIKSTLEEGIKKPTMGSPNPEKVAEYIRMAKNNLEEEHSKLKEVV
ncbi:MAG: argininosuccinate lyase [Thermococcaceae archaeon]|jgi:argininosuccinate lyase|uniref:argininosuccinate lyase n=2 Tax=Thermococcus sp. PK TaxID=913025 RepID=UPI0005B2AA4F|nr:argininosuccinate lyase [Thermococcus sp. PK]MDK2853128.1 argininosuccinate lyase [Thermococcaceae archaeon]MDN5319615.1 argininosuccinate lyase [Thermococcaceae archaeon]